MKKVLIVLFAAALCHFSADADDFTGQSKVNPTTGEEYIAFTTNGWLDNFYIGGSFGASTRFTMGSNSDIVKAYVNPSFDIYIMKWFVPTFGLRFGYQGGNGREGLNSYMPYQINHSALPYKVNGTDSYVESSDQPGCLHYGSMHLHGDVLWSLTNTFWTYNPKRPFNLSLFFSGGYLRLFDNKGLVDGKKGLFCKRYDQELTLGLGVFCTYRITNRLMATAEARLTNQASRYRSINGARTNTATISIGAAYNLVYGGRNGWDKIAIAGNVTGASATEAQEAHKEALAAVEQIKEENKKLSETIDSLKAKNNTAKQDTVYYMSTLQSMSYDVLKEKAQKADLVLYCMISETGLNFSETLHLNNYVAQILKEDPEHIFLITGFADKGTGSSVHNLELSKNRALNVKDILMQKFNVKESNIRVSNFVVDTHADGALDRCVIIESASKQGKSK